MTKIKTTSSTKTSSKLTGLPPKTFVKLPDETVQIGPGTVPTSATSLPSTSIQEMKKKLREASDSGVFSSIYKGENEQSEPTEPSPTS